MTFVGKLLVVFQVLFSVVLMAFAGAVVTVQTNWRTKTEKLQKDLESSRNETAAVANLFEKYKQDAGALQTKLKQDADRYQAESVGTQQKLEAEIAAHNLSKDQLVNQTAVAEISVDEAESRAQQAKVQGEVNVAQAKVVDDKSSLLRTREDELHLITRDKNLMQNKHNELLVEHQKALQVLAMHNLKADPDLYRDKNTPPPSVSGLVLNTKRGESAGTEYVEISIGSDDGLTKGNSLFVYRVGETGRYLGKIDLILVTPDRAVGTVTEKAKNSVIQKGDNVSTKL